MTMATMVMMMTTMTTITTTVVITMVVVLKTGRGHGQARGGVWHGDVREDRGMQHRHLRTHSGGPSSSATGHGQCGSVKQLYQCQY